MYLCADDLICEILPNESGALSSSFTSPQLVFNMLGLVAVAYEHSYFRYLFAQLSVEVELLFMMIRFEKYYLDISFELNDSYK